MLIPSKPQMTWNNAVSDEPKHKNSQITGFNQITYGAATKLTVGVGRHRRWSLIIMLLSIWGHQAKKKKKKKERKRKTDTKRKNNNNKKTTKSQTKHVSRSHTRHNQNQGQPLVNLQSMLHSILAGWPRVPPLVWRAASAEHDAKNWEVTDTLKQAQRRKV